MTMVDDDDDGDDGDDDARCYERCENLSDPSKSAQAQVMRGGCPGVSGGLGVHQSHISRLVSRLTRCRRDDPRC